ncbi:hypothetical protein [Ramlibacter tataouinensis]|uniref:Uncharacterized protein n=1 Tax=Ramlibacter tataouinensis (strain ATCC BAA-407 / DSM 14655 / LMG 21543 / TTB310) TaxID=365046 RepID=F5Y527_RAMTT|nr:hypothetical protein [Ramlibacter tataouinensis]AEG93867.1 hypothetical protein Rta_27640 [Ramlibacter tataouinensis TTB310]
MRLPDVPEVPESVEPAPMVELLPEPEVPLEEPMVPEEPVEPDAPDEPVVPEPDEPEAPMVEPDEPLVLGEALLDEPLVLGEALDEPVLPVEPLAPMVLLEPELPEPMVLPLELPLWADGVPVVPMGVPWLLCWPAAVPVPEAPVLLVLGGVPCAMAVPTMATAATPASRPFSWVDAVIRKTPSLAWMIGRQHRQLMQA